MQCQPSFCEISGDVDGGWYAIPPLAEQVMSVINLASFQNETSVLSVWFACTMM